MTPIEDGRHHLQRSELEALRAENAELKAELADVNSALGNNAVKREALRADVSRLTKERDEALGWMEAARQYANGSEYYRGLVDQIGEMLGPAAKTADDGKLGPEVLRAKVPEVVASTLSALRARVQGLEGALEKILKVEGGDAAGDGWIIRVARAALGSGTGAARCTYHHPDRPSSECPLCSAPQKTGLAALVSEPAPKTFAVEEIEKAMECARDEWAALQIAQPCQEWVDSFRRALGLDGGGE